MFEYAGVANGAKAGSKRAKSVKNSKNGIREAHEEFRIRHR